MFEPKIDAATKVGGIGDGITFMTPRARENQESSIGQQISERYQKKIQVVLAGTTLLQFSILLALLWQFIGW